MDVEAIEAYSEVIAVECKSMWLVGVSCCLDLRFHLSKSADEGGVVWREYQWFVILRNEESMFLAFWILRTPRVLLRAQLRMTDTSYLRSSHTRILDIWSRVSLKTQSLVPIKGNIFFSIL